MSINLGIVCISVRREMMAFDELVSKETIIHLNSYLNSVEVGCSSSSVGLLRPVILCYYCSVQTDVIQSLGKCRDMIAI